MALDHSQLLISSEVDWPGLDVEPPLLVYCGSARDPQYIYNMV